MEIFKIIAKIILIAEGSIFGIGLVLAIILNIWGKDKKDD